MTLSNYYETENDNQYCCETCPDEEKRTTIINEEDNSKTAGLLLTTNIDNDNYSEMFETALENNITLEKTDTLSKNSDFTQAMSQFISSQLDETDEKETLPDLPLSKPPQLLNNDNMSEHNDKIIGLPSNTHSLDSDINSSISNTNQLTTHTAGLKLEINENIVTKDISETFPYTSTPFVKNRMTFFENETKKLDNSNSDTHKKLEMSSTIDNRQINDKKRSDSISYDLVVKDEITTNDDILKITTEELSNNENASDKENNDSKSEADRKTIETESKAITIDDDSTNESEMKQLTIEDKTDFNSSEITDISINTDSEVSSPMKTEDASHNSTNPFEDDEDEVEILSEIVSKDKVPLNRKESYPEELNPFDDDTPINQPIAPVPARRKRISLPKHVALDLFEDDSGASIESPFSPSIFHSKKRIPAARISLTPCWSEEQKIDSAEQKYVLFYSLCLHLFFFYHSIYF